VKGKESRGIYHTGQHIWPWKRIISKRIEGNSKVGLNQNVINSGGGSMEDVGKKGWSDLRGRVWTKKIK